MSRRAQGGLNRAIMCYIIIRIIRCIVHSLCKRRWTVPVRRFRCFSAKRKTMINYTPITRTCDFTVFKKKKNVAFYLFILFILHVYIRNLGTIGSGKIISIITKKKKKHHLVNEGAATYKCLVVDARARVEGHMAKAIIITSPRQIGLVRFLYAHKVSSYTWL